MSIYSLRQAVSLSASHSFIHVLAVQWFHLLTNYCDDVSCGGVAAALLWSAAAELVLNETNATGFEVNIKLYSSVFACKHLFIVVSFYFFFWPEQKGYSLQNQYFSNEIFWEYLFFCFFFLQKYNTYWNSSIYGRSIENCIPTIDPVKAFLLYKLL